MILVFKEQSIETFGVAYPGDYSCVVQNVYPCFWRKCLVQVLLSPFHLVYKFNFCCFLVYFLLNGLLLSTGYHNPLTAVSESITRFRPANVCLMYWHTFAFGIDTPKICTYVFVNAFGLSHLSLYNSLPFLYLLIPIKSLFYLILVLV